MGQTAIRIATARSHQIGEIRRFVGQMMGQLYPPGSYYEHPPDLANFDACYVDTAQAAFYVAQHGDEIVGTGAVRPYDGRFPDIASTLTGGPICELVKFYLHPDWRGRGIGSQLYDRTEQFAVAAGYREGYLHTSLHLPGGYPFWRSRGYVERHWESDDLVHMSKVWEQAGLEAQTSSTEDSGCSSGGCSDQMEVDE